LFELKFNFLEKQIISLGTFRGF